MIINCEVSLVPFGVKPRYSRAKVGLAVNDENKTRCVYIVVITAQKKEKYEFTANCRLFQSAISLERPNKHLYIRNADQLLLKTFMSYLRTVKDGKRIPNLPKLEDVENQKLQANSLTISGYDFDVKEFKNKVLTKVTFDKTYTLPKGLWTLLYLTHLELTNCQLTEMPEKLANLTKLRVLNLSNNHLNVLDINCFSNLSNLVHLNVSHNELPYIPLEIASLRNLIALDFSYNQINSLPFTLIRLVDLKELFISNNNIKLLSRGVVVTLEKQLRLVKFDISGNKMKKLEKPGSVNFNNFKCSLPSLFNIAATSLLRSLRCILSMRKQLPKSLYTNIELSNDICFRCFKPYYAGDCTISCTTYQSLSLATTIINDSFNGRSSVIPVFVSKCFNCSKVNKC